MTSTTLLAGLFNTADGDTWREFDARYRPIIVGFARRLGLSREDSADVAQEAMTCFVQQYRDGKYDRGRGRLRNWLMAIVKHRAVDLLRARAVRREVRGSSAVGELPDEHRLDELWESERKTRLLGQALAELRDSSRMSERTLKAFELYVLKQRPAEVVAEELGISRQDVYVAKNRVAERLREIVVRLDHLFDDG